MNIFNFHSRFYEKAASFLTCPLWHVQVHFQSTEGALYVAWPYRPCDSLCGATISAELAEQIIAAGIAIAGAIGIVINTTWMILNAR